MGDVYDLKQVETSVAPASHFGQLRLHDVQAASPLWDWSKPWQGWYPEKAAGISNQSHELMRFNYCELEAATCKFLCATYFLGKGPYGNLFSALVKLKNSATPTHVTVEQLDPIYRRVNKIWRDEVEYLGQHSHPNLLKLIGYACEEPDKALLIYEPIPDRILANYHLSDATDMWFANMQVAFGVAKALIFLHGLDPPFVWRDPTIERGKIFLDHRLNPKIYNFCSSTSNHPRVTTKLLRAPAYAAPEYYQTGDVTPSCNVYSFGVWLLEMISGREAIDESRPAEERILVDWARPFLAKDEIWKIMDPGLKEDWTRNLKPKVALVAWVAEHCIKRNARLRPSMNDVYKGLCIGLVGRLPNGRTKYDFMHGDAADNVPANFLSKLFFY